MKQLFHFCTESLAFMYPRTSSVVLRSSSLGLFLEQERLGLSGQKIFDFLELEMVATIYYGLCP